METGPAQESTVSTKLSKRIKLPGLWKTLSLVLLIALIASLWLWKPWQANVKASDRTISVTGNATVSAEPDEFIFTPSYDIVNADQQKATTDLTAKNNDIIAKLKALGVPSNKIQSDASNYKDYYNSTTNTYTFDLTITVDDKALAQKVQDYLLSTTPNGNITPQYTFSTAKEKTLEGQARDKAEQDARVKADQSAKNLGFKVKAVKSVQDGSFESFGGCGPKGLCMGANNLNSTTSSQSQSLTLQPGQNDVPYSVDVTYYIQ
jgi:uncharacterized protein